MAEAGIKISQLSNVTNPHTSDYTVLVHDGITCRAALSALRSTFDAASTIDTQKIQELTADVNSIKGKINTISSIVSTLYDYAEKDDLENLNRDVQLYKERTDAAITEISTDISSISEDLGVLINDPEMLKSLTAVIALLSGEDGQASLSNIGLEIMAISGRTENLENEVNEIKPTLEIVKNRLSCELNDEIFQNFNNGNNSAIYSNLEGSQYDFFYDKYRFANINQPEQIVYESAMLSGIKSGTTTLTSFIVENENIPTLEYLAENYDTIKTYDGMSLSNVSIISAEGYTMYDAVSERTNELEAHKREISTLYITESNGAISPITSYIGDEELPFEGEDTFDLEMIPIRAGMFVKEESKDAPTIELKLSGNSNVDFYYANEAKILNGWKSKINININGKTISKKTSNSLIADDTNLNLVFCKRIRGGSIFEIEMDSELTNINNGIISNYTTIVPPPQIDQHNLIAAISPVVLNSEKNEIEVSIISAWTTTNTSGELANTNFIYQITGGRTGDTYLLRPVKIVGDDETPLDIATTSQNQLIINNVDLNIDPFIITLNDGLPLDTEIKLKLIKDDDDTVIYESNSTIIENLIREQTDDNGSNEDEEG